MFSPRRILHVSLVVGAAALTGIAALPAQARISVATEQTSAGGPTDLLKDARFRAAWTRATGPLGRERWIARLEGPAPALRSAAVDGVAYTVGSVCKPHDCGDNNLVLLYDPARGGVLGLVHLSGRNTFLGEPSPTMVGELERLWRQEWRQGR